VLTPQGFVEYNVLVVATGLVPAENEVRNLLENRRLSPHAWTWAGTVELRRAVENFSGGTFVIAVPPPPYKCPPGPYEVACLVDEFWKKKGVRAEVVVLDANDRPQPPLLADLWRRVLADRGIVYKPSFKVVELDPSARALVSDRGERQRFDLASVIPPQRAPLFIEEAGLGAPFVPVDPATFRCRTQENVYALGDVAASPYTKSAFTAFLQGRNAAYSLARALGRDRGDPDPVFNQCWPYVSSTEALLVEVAWTKEGRPVPGRNRTAPASPKHVEDRKPGSTGSCGQRTDEVLLGGACWRRPLCGGRLPGGSPAPRRPRPGPAVEVHRGAGMRFSRPDPRAPLAGAGRSNGAPGVGEPGHPAHDVWVVQAQDRPPYLEPAFPGAKTRVLAPGEREEIQFTPTRPGRYRYVCTVPGHDTTMYGEFVVE
jgi:hypothetical protein